MEMTYKTIDEAYKKEVPKLLNLAKYRMLDKDSALDCVHMAFEKTLQYLKTHPKRKVSGYLLLRELNRLIKKSNDKIRAIRALDEWSHNLIPEDGGRNAPKQLSDNIEHDYGSDSE